MTVTCREDTRHVSVPYTRDNTPAIDCGPILAGVTQSLQQDSLDLNYQFIFLINDVGL